MLRFANSRQINEHDRDRNHRDRGGHWQVIGDTNVGINKVSQHLGGTADDVDADVVAHGQ